MSETEQSKLESAVKIPDRIESIASIKELVFPQGATNALSITVSEKPQYIVTSNGPLFGGLHGDLHRQRNEAISDEVTANIQPVKEQLTKLLDSRRYTDLLLAKAAEKRKNQEAVEHIPITHGEMKDIILPIDKSVEHRLFCLLNYGFDPELIPSVLQQFQDQSPLSPELAEFIATDDEARGLMEAIILKDTQDYRAGSRPDKKKFHAERQAFEKALTEYCQEMMEDDQVPDQLNDFFYPYRSAYKIGFSDFTRDVRSTTSATYFQRQFSYDDEWEESHPGLNNYGCRRHIWDSKRPYAPYDSINDALLEYAQVVESTEYLVWLLKAGKELYQTLFPGVYIDLPIRIYVENKYKTLDQAVSCAGVDQLNAFFLVNMTSSVSIQPIQLPRQLRRPKLSRFQLSLTRERLEKIIINQK